MSDQPTSATSRKPKFNVAFLRRLKMRFIRSMPAATMAVSAPSAEVDELERHIEVLSSSLQRTRVSDDRTIDEPTQNAGQLEWSRITLASLSHAVITTNTEGFVTFMNPVAETLTGWTQDEAVDQPLGRVFNIIDEATRSAIDMPSIHASRDGVIGLVGHTLLVSKDGTEYPVDPSAAPIRTVDGEFAGAVLVFRDVTERYRAVHAIQTSLTYAENIIANLREPFVVLDSDFRVQKGNAAFYRAFHVTPAETINRSLYALGNGQWNIPQLRLKLADVMRDHLPMRDFEVERDFPEMGKRVMVLNASRCVTIGQDSKLILLAFEDVTDRKQTESIVRNSEARFRRLFETARDGILILDADTLKIIDANPFMTELLGYSHAEFMGKELWEIGFFGDKTASQGVYKSLQSQGYIRYDHLPLKTRHGASAEVEFISNLYTVDDKTVAQCNIRDISERSRLERQLNEQTKALADLHRRKDEFLAMLSHELRNPLAPISNAVHLLRLKKDVDPIQQKACSIIQRQILQLTRLVDDLMEVSRITTGRVRLLKERVDIKEIVDRALETTRPLIDERRHELQVTLPQERIWLDADAARIEQVIVNLLSNAAKYTDSGGQIALIVSQEGNQCVLRITDTGVGIEPEILPHIFDLFTQADRSLDRSRGGLGIGLALVHRIIKMHHGHVEVKSVVGQGSEFIVRLPAMRDVSQDQTAKAEPLAHATRSLRICIADDNEDEVTSLAMLLQQLGHEVRTAHDGPTALQVAKDYAPDVMLLDIGLPLMNGYEVAKKLKELNALSNVALVAITGYGLESDRLKSQEAGFAYHLVKPAAFDELQKILTTIANAPQPQAVLSVVRAAKSTDNTLH